MISIADTTDAVRMLSAPGRRSAMPILGQSKSETPFKGRNSGIHNANKIQPYQVTGGSTRLRITLSCWSVLISHLKSISTIDSCNMSGSAFLRVFCDFMPI
jgi:hypothetical protein